MTTVSEMEPNDEVAKAQKVTIPVTITGRADPNDPGIDLFIGDDDVEDVYCFTVPDPPEGSAGTLVRVSVSFDNRDAGDIDIALFKARADGTVIPEEDVFDGSALANNPELFGPRCLPAGTYYLGVSAFDDPTVRVTNYTVQICVGGNAEVAASDSGLPNSGVNLGNFRNPLLVVNCVSACRYPATVTGARLLFFAFQNQPSPRGQQITVIFFKGPAPAQGQMVEPPMRPTITEVASTVSQTFAYFDVSLPENQRFTLNPGEVLYVGLRLPRPVAGLFPTIEVGRTQEKSFVGNSDGSEWEPIAISSGDPVNFVFRAHLQLQ
jgi:hypothetical protein